MLGLRLGAMPFPGAPAPFGNHVLVRPCWRGTANRAIASVLHAARYNAQRHVFSAPVVLAISLPGSGRRT